MAVVTQDKHPGDGSQVDFSITFEYLRRSDVQVALWNETTEKYDDTASDDATNPWKFHDATTIRFTGASAPSAVPDGTDRILIYRETDTDKLVAQFFPGASIRAQDLNDDFTQILFKAQESDTDANQAISDAAEAQAVAEGAVATANDAVTKADSAISKADEAVSTANDAEDKATQALDAISEALPTTLVDDLASLPAAGGQNGSRYVVLDSTGVESAANITDIPADFVGSSELQATVRWESATNDYEFLSYTANDPEGRYATKAAVTAAQTDATQALADASTADGKAVAAQTDATQALSDAASAQSTADNNTTTKVSKAGDTMTGTLKAPTIELTNGGSLTAAGSTTGAYTLPLTVPEEDTGFGLSSDTTGQLSWTKFAGGSGGGGGAGPGSGGSGLSTPRDLAHSQRNNVTIAGIDCPEWLIYGRGNSAMTTSYGPNTSGYIDGGGQCWVWGNLTNSPTPPFTQSYFRDGSGTGNNFSDSFRYAIPIIDGGYTQRGLAGDTDYAKFTTDLEGNDLEWELGQTPKIKYWDIGFTNAVFVSENGLVWSSGYNGYGQIGRNNTTQYYHPQLMGLYSEGGSVFLSGANRPKIKQLVNTNSHTSYNIGSNHSLALSTDGEVFAIGYNAYGQLGFNNTTTTRQLWRIDPSLFNNEKVVWVHVHYYSSYAITETGKLYAWGYNNQGQLGTGNITNSSIPVEMTAESNNSIFGKKILHIMSAGTSSTFLWMLDSEGKIHFCGYSPVYGGYSGVKSTTATRSILYTELLSNQDTTNNSGNQKSVAMWVGNDSGSPVCFTTTDGGDSGIKRTYSWGYNGYGQLARGESRTNTGNATIDSNWLMGEIMFDQMGPTDVMPIVAGSDNVRGFLGDAVVTAAINPGTIVWVGGGTNTYHFFLDDKGQLFYAGYNNTYGPMSNNNGIDYYPGNTGSTGYTASYFDYCTVVAGQPEPFVQAAACGLTTTQDIWLAIGKSGALYGGHTSISRFSHLPAVTAFAYTYYTASLVDNDDSSRQSIANSPNNTSTAKTTILAGWRKIPLSS